LLLPGLLALAIHALIFKMDVSLTAPQPAAIRNESVTIELAAGPRPAEQRAALSPLPPPVVESIEPLRPKPVKTAAPPKPKPPRKPDPVPQQPPRARKMVTKPPAPEPRAPTQKDAVTPVGPEKQPAVAHSQPAGPVDGPQVEPKAQQAATVRMSTPLYELNPPIAYPLVARRRNYEGTVMLDVLVGSDGMVRDLRLAGSSGYPVLDRSAMAQVRTWRFEPARKGEQPIPMWVKIPVRFELR
jgi:protein TonB